MTLFKEFNTPPCVAHQRCHHRAHCEHQQRCVDEKKEEQK